MFLSGGKPPEPPFCLINKSWLLLYDFKLYLALYELKYHLRLLGVGKQIDRKELMPLRHMPHVQETRMSNYYGT